MTIPPNNDAAFHKQLDKNKEQADGLKYHGEYELDRRAVPTDEMGYANVVGINKFVVDPDIPGATAKIWFAPNLLKKIFGACKVCYKHEAVCHGHEPRPQPKAEGKRPAAAEANAAAQKRMKAKADKGKQGGFSFN